MKNKSSFVENVDEDKLKKISGKKIQQIFGQHRNTDIVRINRQQCNDTQGESVNSLIVSQKINSTQKKSCSTKVKRKNQFVVMKTKLSSFIENIDDEKLKKMGSKRITHLLKQYCNTDNIRIKRHRRMHTDEDLEHSNIRNTCGNFKIISN